MADSFTLSVNTTQSSLAPTSATTIPLNKSSSVMNNLVHLQLVLMITIGFIGSLGNSLVLLVLTKRKHRTRTSSILLLNLAVCDTLVSALCIPLDITLLTMGRWVFGSHLCQVIYPFQTSLPIVSSYTLMFMLLERNMIFSSHFRSRMRPTTVKLLAFATWLLPAAMVTPYALKLHVNGTRDESCVETWSNDLYRKIYTVSLSVVEYLIPIVLIMCFVIRIIQFLRRERNMVKRGLLGLGRRLSKRRIKSQRRLAVIFIVMVVTYASLKLPNNVFWQWLEFGGGGESQKIKVVHLFVGLCAYATCATNPFILIIMSSEFRTDLHNMLCSCKKPGEWNCDSNLNRNESGRTATTTTGSMRSNMRHTISTGHVQISHRVNRPILRSDSLESGNEMKKMQSVSFKEPEQIPMNNLDITS